MIRAVWIADHIRVKRLRPEKSLGHLFRQSEYVPVDMLGFTGPEGVRVVAPGAFELQIGASSADIKLRSTIEVIGKKRSLGKNWTMFSRFQATLE